MTTDHNKEKRDKIVNSTKFLNIEKKSKKKLNYKQVIYCNGLA